MTSTAQKHPEELCDVIKDDAAPKNTCEDELDAAHHRNRSIRRQASMKRRLESGGSLSNAHSNTWPLASEEESEDIQKNKAINRAEFWGKRQTHRRQVLQDRIEHGKALSNSTGGHWYDGESDEHREKKQDKDPERRDQ